MKTILELEVEHNLLLEDLNQRLLKNINKLGGFTKSAKKIDSSLSTVSYSLATDNFQTKIKILKRLEEVK